MNLQENKSLLGIFDSGVGGFSVYKQIRKVSSADCIYYGDCARAPYGNRDEAEIVEFIKDDIAYLQEQEVTHFVNACNSMSVFTTDLLLQECKISPRQYIDMIRAFDMHASFTQKDKVLIVATVATIRSGAYQDVLTRKGVTCFEYAFTDLAGAIERNASEEELMKMVKEGILYAYQLGATHVVYGCTHFPLIHQLFLYVQKNLNWQGEFIDPAVYVALEIQKWNLVGERRFTPYSSKDTAVFIKQIAQLY